MTTYKNKTKAELWKEILLLIDCTNFSETDKDIFRILIETYSLK